jgi:hypothetical protein
MHALIEPPVSPPMPGAPVRAVPAPTTDQRRVVVRLRDGERILIARTPSLAVALELAKATIAKLDGDEQDEWPMLGDRFINPDAIVSVDVLRLG